MKKRRIIPCLLLLVLCVGILGVGIYAAMPATTKIGASITIIAPSKELDITGYIDGIEKLPTDSVHDITEWDLSTLSFNLSDKSSIEEVEDIQIKVHIKNKSNFEYGAYFYKKDAELDANGNATINSFENLNTTIVNEDSVTLANVTLSDYTHIMKCDDNKTDTTLDEADMTITLSLAEFFMEEQKPGDISFILRIEKYIPNFTSDGEYTGSEKFVRLSSNIDDTTNPRTTIANEAFFSKTIQKVVFPRTIESLGMDAFSSSEIQSVNLNGCINLETIGTGAFDSCALLKNVIIPNAKIIKVRAFNCCYLIEEISILEATTIEQAAFRTCIRLQSVKISNKLNEVGSDAFANCPSTLVFTYSGTLAEFKGITGYTNISDSFAVIINGVTYAKGTL